MSEQAHSNGVPICLVDDDPSVLKSTSRLLKSAGRKAETFSDPSMFLNYAATHRPRLAVLDVCMPPMHGLEVQRRLRGISPDTKVIILTSKDDPVVRSQALLAGAISFFTKPIAEDEFLSEIEAVLSES